jgi:hypothetical protein
MIVYMAKKPIPKNTGKTYQTRKAMNVKAEMFIQFFTNPTSNTFMNVLQSGLRAGYSEQYSENITVQRPKWWIELTETADYKRAKMLDKAESRLNDRLIDTSKDKDRLKLQTDVAKFVSERLGKDKYSTRQEVTGADGRRLFSSEARNSAKMPIATLFKGVSTPD